MDLSYHFFNQKLEIMGGEGAMMAMITSLKNNSSRKKRTQFDKQNAGGYGTGEKAEFDFPEVTPEVLKNIRERLQKEHKQLQWKRAVVFTIIVVLLIMLILY